MMKSTFDTMNLSDIFILAIEIYQAIKTVLVLKL